MIHKADPKNNTGLSQIQSHSRNWHTNHTRYLQHSTLGSTNDYHGMQMQDASLSMPSKGNHTKEVAMRRTAPALTVSCEGVWRLGKDEREEQGGREIKRDSTGSKVGDAKDEREWEGESRGAGRPHMLGGEVAWQPPVVPAAGGKPTGWDRVTMIRYSMATISLPVTTG